MPTPDLNDSDPLFNYPFTIKEVAKFIAKLKNNKSPGTDQISNKFLKKSIRQTTDLLTKLFSLILASGVVSEQWSIGVIKPIYKASGDDTDPSNYRGITLLSYLAKLFSNLNNHRLTLSVDNNNIIGPEQPGFWAVFFLTTDPMFPLKTLIDFYNHKRKKLFCCFVDYSKAFDSISRTKLWHKLLESNISGKKFNSVHNTYKTAKSCVSSDGQISDTPLSCWGKTRRKLVSLIVFDIPW